MEASTPPSATPSHYSKEAIGLVIGAGIFALIICVTWGYIYHKGGPKEMLRAHRERRKAKRQARDIEMAQAEVRADRAAVQEYKQRIAQKETQDTVDVLMMANGLVGGVVTPPQRVDFREDWDKECDEELRAQRMKQLHVQKGKVVRKDSMDLEIEPAIDPMSFPVGRGKGMAALYR